jgi:hypothetical protein
VYGGLPLKVSQQVIRYASSEPSTTRCVDSKLINATGSWANNLKPFEVGHCNAACIHEHVGQHHAAVVD